MTFTLPAPTLKTICNTVLRCSASSLAVTSSRPTVRPQASAPFSTTSTILSGHSRWSKIKHDKGKADLRRGEEFSKISREIITAAKVDGADSLRLKAALELGKKAGMSKSRMESAAQRGLGVSREGVQLQVLTIEAIGPVNVSLIVDCLTDNKLRTLQAIKYLLKEGRANVTDVAYLFSRKGRLFYTLNTGLPEPQPTLSEVYEETFEKAMETDGVEDVELIEEGGGGGEPPGISVITVPELANTVSKQIMGAMSPKLKVEKIAVEWVAKEDTMIDPESEGTPDDWDKLRGLIDTLEEADDVQGVYTNARSL
ncbi:transcriptional regulator TACO1-like protein [Tirmania nivea]|nr:transcriptional regulator TACO1-like protein [Tirmania nivea]